MGETREEKGGTRETKELRGHDMERKAPGKRKEEKKTEFGLSTRKQCDQ